MGVIVCRSRARVSGLSKLILSLSFDSAETSGTTRSAMVAWMGDERRARTTFIIRGPQISTSAVRCQRSLKPPMRLESAFHQAQPLISQPFTSFHNEHMSDSVENDCTTADVSVSGNYQSKFNLPLRVPFGAPKYLIICHGKSLLPFCFNIL